MKIKSVVSVGMGENCYIVIDDTTGKAVIIDPGENTQGILEKVNEEGAEVEYIMLTHCHFDHIGAVEPLKKELGCQVIIPKGEEILAENPVYNLSAMTGSEFTINYDRVLENGDKISFGNIELKLISTPGHTPGGACYYSEEYNVLFSGDTLFYMSVGRSDFPLGDGALLNKSIIEKLFVLPDETQVFTGHGNTTTIGFEKQNNMYVW